VKFRVAKKKPTQLRSPQEAPVYENSHDWSEGQHLATI
jgi:hypothetical protein